jgi:hypothetical protein
MSLKDAGHISAIVAKVQPPKSNFNSASRARFQSHHDNFHLLLNDSITVEAVESTFDSLNPSADAT